MTATPYLFDLPKILDERGNLSFLQEQAQIPFEIKRVYWIYDIPSGETRGSHAFHQSQEIVIALSGGLDVILNDGHSEQTFKLNRPFQSLYIPKLHWRTLENFSSNAVVLIISSTHYHENDYIRLFSDFQAARHLAGGSQ